MNSVAGGGSFLSFPSLVFAGVAPISANATNNAAMWVGTIGSARGYREEVAAHRGLLFPVIAVSVAGSLIGACLLLVTPQAVFERLIPWLLLFATIVFALSPRLTRGAPRSPRHAPWQIAVQFCVAIYGGYFGAGMGILMLAVLAFSGLPSFNAQNAIKNVLAVAINGVALIPFVVARIVDWRFALPMAVIALAGGYLGARFFRRVPQPFARGVVVVIGIVMTIVFFARTFV
ncbi:MAG: sulfite exporter TauE/SafE family protein [Candidatus Eremiobacteraeota bacterium]|nr:sulfite exporter TauE/SafE family protein [Candidatus Eremiobacteraeota bacterium]MBV8499089.1 sulfite exporter TauE/SafE family protein [Candidatus Eremiobacteraeota bacterium]